ncbi:UNVERIFIED_CONTAM: hypothetical protein K2H54_048918 [Gekko kuhli]
MQGPGPNQLNMTNNSMNMPSSSHGSMGGYNHSVPSSQSIPVQNQMTMSQGQPMGNYGPRPNISMQPNQGPMMHQQPPSQQYNMPQGGGQHYQGQQPPMGIMGQVNQGNHMMGQRQIPPYRPPQQGPPQQYSGQEDYYGDQYSHGGQGPPEGMNQQYYPDGHSDYGYQQPSYPEQGYDRPYEDSSQHYYEGGNSQYAQQQDAYQGPPQQQGYQQQQYPSQQGYPGQQQGYGSEFEGQVSCLCTQPAAPGMLFQMDAGIDVCTCGGLWMTLYWDASLFRSPSFSNTSVHVLHKVVPDPSIPTIPKGKANSMGDTGRHSLAPHSHHSRGLTDMTRDSMATTSNEECHLSTISSIC